MTQMTVLSLGWGCQSFALAAMSALGVLPPLDAAIHADTTHERAETYEFAARWTPWLQARGVRLVTVTNQTAADYFNRTHNGIPAFTINPKAPYLGALRRSCTEKWKIRPIRRWLQQQRAGRHVEQWIGITLDEVQRLKNSDVQYVTHTYPFLDMLTTPWTRTDAINWLRHNDLEVPVKSSCVFCPYHSSAEWNSILSSANGDWDKALAVDNAVRHSRPGYTAFLVNKRKPLTDMDFRTPEQHGQLAMWDEDCSGICGV